MVISPNIMSKKDMLIEIGVEELPAIPLLKIEKEIKLSWEKILSKNRVRE